jgi:NADPH:quinone reductase-like Zn-dependent oxidoreductase
MGVRDVLDPGAADFADAVMLATAGAGVDLVLDTVGASALQLHLQLLRRRGRMVILGLLGGGRAEIDLALILRKRLRIEGSVLRSRPIEEKLTLARRFARHVLPLFADGALSPQIDRVLALDEAPAAHALMERNENFGKIVLRIRPS